MGTVSPDHAHAMYQLDSDDQFASPPVTRMGACWSCWSMGGGRGEDPTRAQVLSEPPVLHGFRCSRCRGRGRCGYTCGYHGSATLMKE